MNHVITRTGIVLASLLGTVSIAAAQHSSHIPPLLLLPGSTRGLGLGNAFVAGDGPEMIFYNPAQLGSSRGTTLSYERIGSSQSLGSMASSTTALGASIGVGAQYLEFDHSSTSNLEASLGAAIERKGIRVGFTTKYAQQQVGGRRTGIPAVDLGFATVVSSDFANITLGLAVLDAGGLIGGRSPSGIHLPTRISLGGMITGVPLGTWFDVGAAASILAEEGNRFTPAGGVEVTYVPVSGYSFVGRVGAIGMRDGGRKGPGGGMRDAGGAGRGLTLGATFGIDRLAFDYAFEARNIHRIGVRIR